MELATKFMPKCPVCKKPLSLEMVAIGNDKGEEKMKPKFDAILGQIIRYAIESAIRAYAEHGRSLYYTCNNAECPCRWTMASQTYFKKSPVGTVDMVGDSTGVVLNFYRGMYQKKQKAKKIKAKVSDVKARVDNVKNQVKGRFDGV